MKSMAPVLAAIAIAGLMGCGTRDDSANARARNRPNDTMTGTTGTDTNVRFFLPPSDLKSGDPVCTDASRRLVAGASQAQSIPDDQMRQSSTCTSPELALFVRANGRTDTGTGMGTEPQGNQVEMFVKVDNNRYLMVKPE